MLAQSLCTPADVWGVRLILNDARCHCAGILIEAIKQKNFYENDNKTL